GEIDVADLTVTLPGVRLTLWLGAAIILVAGALAMRALQPTVGSERRERDPGPRPGGTEAHP
ncbi:MAG TPA: hypothetical protein VHH09_07920, partial [Acidimicrobiales bacterium]|nr:hypothetical protein [Acidimicrobiales bacterium]